MTETEIGIVRHYFDKIGVAAIDLTAGGMAVGDTIHVKGHTTDVTAAVVSMQIEHEIVQSAAKGKSVGIKLADKVREHDKVFKVLS
jgi:putative protease